MTTTLPAQRIAPGHSIKVLSGRVVKVAKVSITETGKGHKAHVHLDGGKSFLVGINAPITVVHPS